jgi:hypothetical protein
LVVKIIKLRIGNKCDVGIFNDSYTALKKMTDDQKKTITQNFASMIGVPEIIKSE